jgi:hypothetical protein
VLVDKAQCQSVLTERWRPGFPFMVAVVAEPDNFRLGFSGWKSV